MSASRSFHRVPLNSHLFVLSSSSLSLCCLLGLVAMASEAEASSILEQMLRRQGQIGRGFFPILIGLTGRPAVDGEAAPPPDEIVLVILLTRGFVVLQGDAAADLMSEIASGGYGRRGPPPASKASIESLRALDAGEVGGDEECPVCLDGLAGVSKEMPCKHRFHGACIEKWLTSHGSCPICRFQMPVEKEVGAKKIGDEEGDRTGRRVMEMVISIGRIEIGGEEREED